MNNVRIDRMLRELHAGPPLRFFEDIFALRGIVSGLIARMHAPRVFEEARADLASPVLAGGPGHHDEVGEPAGRPPGREC